MLEIINNLYIKWKRRWEVHGKVQTKGTVNSEVKKLFELWVYQKKKNLQQCRIWTESQRMDVCRGESYFTH